MVFRVVFLAILPFGALVSAGQARQWTDASKRTIEAEIVSYKDGTVGLKRKDGFVGSLPAERLSAVDQLYAQRWLEREVCRFVLGPRAPAITMRFEGGNAFADFRAPSPKSASELRAVFGAPQRSEQGETENSPTTLPGDMWFYGRVGVLQGGGSGTWIVVPMDFGDTTESLSKAMLEVLEILPQDGKTSAQAEDEAEAGRQNEEQNEESRKRDLAVFRYLADSKEAGRARFTLSGDPSGILYGQFIVPIAAKRETVLRSKFGKPDRIDRKQEIKHEERLLRGDLWVYGPVGVLLIRKSAQFVVLREPFVAPTQEEYSQRGLDVKERLTALMHQAFADPDESR